MTMITPSYLGETIEYSSLHACRSTLEDPTDAANNWSTGNSNSNWSTDSAGATDANQVPGGITDVVFAASNAVPNSGSTLTTQLDGNFPIKGLTIAVPTTSPTQITSTVINPNGNTLTIGADGLTLAAASLSSATLGAGAISLGVSQNWANNNATLGLSVNSNISASSGATTLTLNGTGAGGVTLAGSISDGGGTLAVVFNQAGVTTLSGTNTYSGGTTVSSGTLRIGSSASLPSGGAVAVDGILDLNTYSASVGALSGGGTIDTVAGGTPTLTVGANNASSTFAGTLQNTAGTLALQKVGSGNVALTGVNTYGGGTTISAGILGINADAALGASTSGVTFSGNGALQAVADNIVIGASRALTINNGVVGTIDTQAFTTTVPGGIGGGGGLAKAGSGTLILTGSKSYSGGTTVNLGSLQLGDGTSSNGLVSGNIVNNATVNFANPAPQTFSGAVSGGGAFQKSGAGTLLLTGLNTYTGPTVITGGTLRVSALGSSNVAIVNGSFESPTQTTFQYYGSMTTTQQAAFAWTGSGNVTSGGPVSVRSGWGYTTPYPDGGQVVSIQKDASISQSVNFPTAGTYQLNWSAEDRPGNAGNPINVQLDGSTINSFSNTNSANWTSYGATFNVATPGNHTIGFVGTVTNSDQTVGLDNVVLGAASALPSTTAVQITNSGATFDVDDTTTAIGSLAGVAGSTVALGSGALSVGTDGTSTTYAGTISDTGGLSTSTGGRLVKVGSGVLTLSGTNTYTGGTVLNGGELTFDATTALPATPTAAISFGGGTLRYTANNTTDYSGRFSNAASQAYSVDTNGLNISFGAPLTSVGGSFAKSGAGILTFNSANTYTGNTAISGGTLRLGVAGALPSTGALVMSSTGILDLNGNNATVTDISASAITNQITDNSAGTGVSTLTVSAFVNTINSLITDGATQHVAVNISNNLTGSSLFPLNNANTFSGGLTLLNNTGALGTRLRISGAVTTVGSPGAITSSPFGTGPIIIGQGPTDKAGILLDSVNNITIENAITFNTAVGNDVPGIRFDTNGNTLSGIITANLVDARFSTAGGNTGSVSLTGQVTGAGGLNVTPTGTGALTVTLNNAAGTNNYQGATTIGANGTVIQAAANQIPHGPSTGDVTNNGKLSLGGFNTTINGLNGGGLIDGVSGSPTLTVGDNNASGTFSGIIANTAGSLSLAKIGSGTQTLALCRSSYSGGTTISGGTLKLGGGSFVSPVNATSESYFAPDDRAPIHAVDGSGQSVAGLPSATAGTATASSQWLSNGTTQTWITFDLGSVQTVAGFHLWNYNESSSGNYNARGVATAGVYTGNSLLAQGSSYASAGSAWGTLAQNFSFNEATGQPTYTGSDYSFTTPVTTRYLQIYVTGNFEIDAYTGISEIGFYSNSSVGNLPAATPVQIASGANLDLNGAMQTIGSLADGTAGGGSVINSNGSTAAALILNPTGGSTTFSGTISDTGVLGALSLTMNGTGTQILSGANSYNGGTTIAGGTLRLSGAGTLGATTGALTVNGGVLDLNGTSQGVGNLSGNGGTILNSAPSTVSTLTVGNGNAGGTFSGLIADNSGSGGTVALVKTGAGTITLAGANTYSGGTTIGGSGTLRVANTSGSALGSGNVTLNAGTLASGPVGSISGNVLAGTVAHIIAPGGVGSIGTLSVGSITSSSNTTYNFDLGAPVASNSYTGDLVNLTGSGLTVGSGTSITFGMNPTAQGDYRLFSGSFGTPTLSNFTLPAAPAGLAYTLSTSVDPSFIDLVVGPGVFTAYWNSTGLGTASWNSSGNWTNLNSVPNSAGSTAIFDNSLGASATSTATLDGNEIVGHLIFNNNSVSYTIAQGSSGTLTIDNNASAATGVPSIDVLNSGSHTISAPVALANGVTITTSADPTSPAAYALTISGAISGSGGLVKAGPGTLQLSSTNSYGGGTTVNAGTLRTTANNALGNGPLAANAAVTLGGNESIGSLSGSGGSVSVAAGKTLAVNQTADGALAGSLTLGTSGAGANLSQSGTNSLTLSGVTTINQGSAVAVSGSGALHMNVASGSTIGSGVTVTVSGSASLQLDGMNSALADPSLIATKRAAIVNTSTAAAGVDVLGGATQQVGGIDGDGVNTPGNVVLENNSNLTADHINQTSLVIGAGSVFTLAPSDLNGNPMAIIGSAGGSLVLAGSLAPTSSFLASSGSLLGAGAASSAPSVALGGLASGASGCAAPEPASILLVLLGAMALVPALRQKRRGSKN